MQSFHTLIIAYSMFQAVESLLVQTRTQIVTTYVEDQIVSPNASATAEVAQDVRALLEDISKVPRSVPSIAFPLRNIEGGSSNKNDREKSSVSVVHMPKTEATAVEGARASFQDAIADGLKVPTMEKMEDPGAELRKKEQLEKMLPLLLKGALSKHDTHPDNGAFNLVDSGVWRAACHGSSSPKKIIISLVAGALPPGYIETLRRNRLMVAQKNNYRYCEYTHSLDTSRHIIWSKILAVRTLLNESPVPVVWMDADAWFTNPDHNFETITDHPFMTKDAAFSADIGGRPINLGVFVTKSTSWTKQFWADVWNDVSNLDTTFLEQGAVTDWRAHHMAEFNAHAVIIPCYRMNNVGSSEGEFIAHPAGGSWDPSKYQKALAFMRQIQDKFISQ